MTSGEATFGRQLKNGADQAIADINAAGGVLGKKLNARRRRRRLRSEAGPLGRRKSSPAKAAAVRRRALLLVVVDPGLGSLRRRRRAADHAGLDQSDRSPSATCGTRSASAAATTSRARSPADYIAKNYKGKNVAILHDKSTYGKGLADEMKKALNKAGVKEKMYESYNKGDKDFTALVSRMKRNNIDVVYVGGYHQEAGLIVRQMRDQGMKTVLMSGDAMADNEFCVDHRPGRRRYAVHLRPRSAQEADGRRSSTKFKDKGVDPEGYTLYTYAAMQVWAQAAAKAGTTDPRRSPRAMQAGTWDTVLGPISFDKKGDITTIDYVVYKWDKNGNYDEVDRQGNVM